MPSFSLSRSASLSSVLNPSAPLFSDFFRSEKEEMRFFSWEEAGASRSDEVDGEYVCMKEKLRRLEVETCGRSLRARNAFRLGG